MSGSGAQDAIGGLMAPAIATVAPTATLREAAESMMANGLGLLVVVGTNGPVGVLSERDIVAAVTEELDLAGERVRDHASDEIVSVEHDATVADAARAMADAQIRHLAVTRDSAVIGVVSVRDVLRSLVD
jgi:CBS domain-containing protein